MTEPTDAELTAFTDAFDWEGWISPALSKRAFARAVLAKWGQPSGAGEVVYQASYKDGFWQDCSRERYEYLKAPKISSSVDWTSRILYTAPQPTQAQAGAVPPIECNTEELKRAYAFGWWSALEKQREALHAGAVPLNHKNIEPVRRFLADRGIYLSDETTKALITVANGIKGGQHGADT